MQLLRFTTAGSVDDGKSTLIDTGVQIDNTVLQINPDQEPPAMTNEIDPINLSIVKHLRDGRRSFRDIAKDLSVSENTIRSRVQKLTDAGVTLTGL